MKSNRLDIALFFRKWLRRIAVVAVLAWVIFTQRDSAATWLIVSMLVFLGCCYKILDNTRVGLWFRLTVVSAVVTAGIAIYIFSQMRGGS